MAYVCVNCFEVYDRPFEFCPKVNCWCEEVVEIDELMVPTIIALNKKGYISSYCCSGHPYEKWTHPYIAFDDMMNDILNWDEYKHLFDNIPEPWEYVNCGEQHHYKDICIRCTINDKDDIKKYEKLVNANLALLKFVDDSLPELEY